MLIESKNMIPQVYSRERDMQVFNKLIDIIATCCKYDIDKLGYVYDAFNCPKQLLPLLAYTLNYNYNYDDTVTSNRRIIDAFPIMERNKGGETGLKMAAALSLTSLDESKNNGQLTGDDDYLKPLRDLVIHYDYETATIYIDYPNVYTLVRYLMDYVRPVGMYLELRSITGQNIDNDAIIVYAGTDYTQRPFDKYMDSGVSKSFVNFSTAADENWFTFTNQAELDMNVGE